jgi:hypothetical protein
VPKHRKTRESPVAHPPAQREPDRSGSPAAAEPTAGELLRRTLLILVTALLVARPAVIGEDPGMQYDLTDPSNMVLTLLWFAAAVGWAIWRLLARPAADESGRPWWPPSGAAMVEVALLATAGIVFLSAEIAARSRHPARLIAWEWVGLFVAFFVVRRLAARPEDQQGLLTVLLAGAVALSAHGVYQEFVELPQTRQAVGDKPEALRKALAERGISLAPDDPVLALMNRRVRDNHVFGTYAHPNSFAGVLALFLPGLVGAAVVSWRARLPAWRTALAVGCALLTGAALLLTHSRGAIGALVLVGLVVAVGLGWSFWRRHRGIVLAGLLVLAAAAYGVYATGLWTTGIGKESGTVALRLDYWRTTWHIIVGRPWLGVGPGNFGQAYTRYMDENVLEQIKDPHDFALEVWATSGVFALIALLTALAAFFVTAVRQTPAAEDCPGSPTRQRGIQGGPGSEGEPPLRWEYYVGGVFGLLLGFLLRAGEHQSGEILAEAYAAGLRTLFWFPAFALLEHVPWTRRERALVLTAGIAALLLNLTVSGGISFPSVAGPLWVAIALTLAAVTARREVKEDSSPSAEGAAARYLPLPIFAAVALAYLVYVFEPVTSARALLQKGERSGRAYLDQIEKNKEATFLAPLKGFKKEVIAPLDEAAQNDLEDARIQAVRAAWYGQLFRLELMAGYDPLRAREAADAAVKAAVRAQQLDPGDARGFLAEYHLHQLFAELLQVAADNLTRKAKKTANQALKGEMEVQARRMEDQGRGEHVLAARALARHVPDDPTNPILRYRIALAFVEGGDRAAGKGEAAAALELDDRLHRPTRRLTDQQREELRKVLGSAARG